MDRFWPTDEQFAGTAPLLPDDTRGEERGDDRRVISDIIDVLKSGGRGTDAPREIYGPQKTLDNRVARRAANGIWVALFETPARAGGPPSQVLIDSTAVKAHRCAAGGKGGSRAKPSVARGPARRPADRRADPRLQGRGAAARTPARLPHRAGGQGLRQ